MFIYYNRNFTVVCLNSVEKEKEAGDIGIKREKWSSLIEDNGSGDAWCWKDSQRYKIILDIDECQQKRCGTNATCTNTEGSFRCSCNDGYYGDGYNCTGVPVFYSVFSTEILWSLQIKRLWKRCNASIYCSYFTQTLMGWSTLLVFGYNSTKSETLNCNNNNNITLF